MKVEVGSLTDVGRIRDHNEDAFSVDSENHIYVVADGMGGYLAGEVASNALKNLIPQYLRKDDNLAHVSYAMAEAVKFANRKIYKQGMRERDKRGMGTTCEALCLGGGKYYIGHVGDSRAYLIREGRLFQITRDHSKVYELYRAGKITRAQMKTHPYSHVITRCIGKCDDVEPDVYHGKLKAGDRFLLCSDGLYGEVREDTMLQLAMELDAPQELCKRLVREANLRGGKDNITVVLVHVVELSPADLAEQEARENEPRRRPDAAAHDALDGETSSDRLPPPPEVKASDALGDTTRMTRSDLPPPADDPDDTLPDCAAPPADGPREEVFEASDDASPARKGSSRGDSLEEISTEDLAPAAPDGEELPPMARRSAPGPRRAGAPPDGPGAGAEQVPTGSDDGDAPRPAPKGAAATPSSPSLDGGDTEPLGRPSRRRIELRPSLSGPTRVRGAGAPGRSRRLPLIAAAVVSLLVLAGVGLYLAFPSGPAMLFVDSVPVEAEIFLNGTRHGTTPQFFPKLAPGEYELRLRSKGYKEYRSVLTLHAGESHKLPNVTLEKN